MSSIVLARTKQEMPLVGFGLWKVTKSSCKATVYKAIQEGYRLFDGAGDYGNEKEAGEGVRQAIDDGLVKREDLFITSKLWNTFHAKEHVKALATKQLGLWGLDYFDLFLVHFPIALKYVDPAERYPPEWFGADGKTVHLQDTPMQETWTAMEELVDAGLAKNIGISNCQGSIILDILRYARIKPQVLQIEHHPYLTQEALVALARELGIAITAYSSFGPQSYVELSMDRGDSLLKNVTVSTIADRYSKSSAQVLLRWATQRRIAVVPKSNDDDRLKENLDSESFDLSEDDIKAISSLNRNLRMNDPADIDVRMSIFA
ncbi:NADP-dependent oxidoreductase domain-containing protein [Mycena maculata]|uniref:NADP-dependent oxidoreductase domain-containing protein n=1 Tax=Mycena maculata TaxID=230809 RepID=A0AAD7MRM8_9AGAR|nr:NADP-dependent oxidoreductase domain-containing protein [Mycena maculata]